MDSPFWAATGTVIGEEFVIAAARIRQRLRSIIASITFNGWVQAFKASNVFFHIFFAIACTMIVGDIASLLFATRMKKNDLRGLTMRDLCTPTELSLNTASIPARP